MDVRRLRYFVAVAEEQHFSRAAERLGIQQPPLSAQIRQLEKEVGAPLFNRGARSVTLTEAGKLLLKEARGILERVDEAQTMVQRYIRGETGTMVVGFSGATYLAALVPGIIRAYLARFPDVTVRPKQSSTAELTTELYEGRVDAAFLRPPLVNQRAFRLQAIVDEEMFVALPHGHRLESAEAIDLSSLSEETLTLPPRWVNPGFYDPIITAFHEAGLSPRIGHEAAPTIAALPSMVAAGFGVSIVPRSVSQIQVEHVAYRPIVGGSLHAPIALVCRRANCPATAQQLIAVARECVRSNQPPIDAPGEPLAP
jgi:DNA-binding transcriptional LysR family regulator